jgi:endogenous inhibitor of DNA gyrase (YacG/DUF329 family)
MPEILINCPKTGKPVRTGFNVPDRATLDSNTYSGNAVTCPHCRGVHTWGNAEAYVSDDKVEETKDES